MAEESANATGEPRSEQEHPNALRAYETLGRFLEEEDVRPSVAEFITRANYGMHIGNLA